MMIESGWSSCGFRDLVRYLVEVSQVLIGIVVVAGGGGGGGGGGDRSSGGRIVGR